MRRNRRLVEHRSLECRTFAKNRLKKAISVDAHTETIVNRLPELLITVDDTTRDTFRTAVDSRRGGLRAARLGAATRLGL